MDQCVVASASVNQVNGTNVLDAMDDVLMPAV
jgi:hypothetical protein